MKVNLNEVIVTTSTGEKINLSQYNGQVLLIVNVASQCGFTKQYSGLQVLQDRYRAEGFQVLGFPCNDFGQQEPGSLKQIQEFCSLTYKATFTLFEKVHAKGETTEPYTTLNHYPQESDVEWNFEKFLINKKGDVIGRFKSSIEPDDPTLKVAIEKALSS
tara:strand:+ start:103 stop:582 length:480 start_codon:yes stop_codon:yes gene_type:complete